MRVFFYLIKRCWFDTVILLIFFVEQNHFIHSCKNIVGYQAKHICCIKHKIGAFYDAYTL